MPESSRARRRRFGRPALAKPSASRVTQPARPVERYRLSLLLACRPPPLQLTSPRNTRRLALLVLQQNHILVQIYLIS